MHAAEMMDREERPAHVRFERRPVEVKSESIKSGRTVYKDIDWILVTPPYSRDVFEDKAENWLNKQRQQVREGRVPQKFYDFWKECYDKWKIGQEAPVHGTDIRNWAAVTPAQIKTMQACEIRTIEDMAACNAEGLQRIGMGGQELKNKALAWLKGADNQGALVMENAELKRKVESLERNNESLQEKVRTLQYQLQNAGGNIQQEEAIDVEISAADILSDDDDLESLKKRYEQKFGKPPHWNMKAPKMKQLLREE